jgi:hypothetical protein
MSKLGAAFDVATGRCEKTLTALSEHDAEAEALEARRRYTEPEMRRANVLHYLSLHAV